MNRTKHLATSFTDWRPLFQQGGRKFSSASRRHLAGLGGIRGSRLLVPPRQHRINPSVTMASGGRDGSAFTADAFDFHDRIFQQIRQGAFVEGTDRNEKVLDFQYPEDMKKLFDLEIRAKPATPDELVKACENTVKYSVKTAHPHWFNQLYAGVDPYSVAGAWITEALNTNQHTYEVAPVFNIMEKYMMEKLCSIVGFTAGEGMFFPGGNVAQMVGIHLARYQHNKAIKATGHYGGKPLVIFTSREAHYSSKTAASFMGFGTDNVVAVDTDERSRIVPDDLENQILQCMEQGKAPCLLVATAGTTVIGGFDPIDACADICRKYSMWLHVDAAWGGGVMLSKNHKHLVQGIHRADSVLWNLHKMLGSQLHSSAVLVKRKGLLQECNGLEATYLYHKDKFYDISYDVGDMSIQCGRKADAFKNWLMWKSLGTDGLAARIDKGFQLASYLTERLRTTDGFRLVQPEFDCLNICFWYIPPRLRGQPETTEWWDEIRTVAPKIKERMMLTGKMMIGYSPLESRGLVNFFRIIVKNPQLTQNDMDYVIDTLEEFGKDL